MLVHCFALPLITSTKEVHGTVKQCLPLGFYFKNVSFFRERLHWLWYPAVFSAHSEGYTVFLTFPLALISLHPSWTWVIWLFIHSQTHNDENELIDSANRIPGACYSGEGSGLCRLSHMLLHYSHVVGGGAWTQTNTHTTADHTTKILCCTFSTPNNWQNEITPSLHIPYFMNINWN